MYKYLRRCIYLCVIVFINSIFLVYVKNVYVLYNFTVKMLLEMKCLSLALVMDRVCCLVGGISGVVAFVDLGGGSSCGRRCVAEVVVV
jgi:hypothetical protein